MIDIYSRGVARIRYATTGEVFEIDADELEWEGIGSDERQMGPENAYAAAIHHPVLGQLIWSLWEYPIGAENMTETDINGHELLENIDFGLQQLPDDEPEEEHTPPLAVRLANLPGQLDELDRALAKLREAKPMFGHNQPPPEFRLELDDAEIDAARESIAEVRTELAKPDPIDTADATNLGKADGRLRQLASKVWGWLQWAGKAVGAGVLGAIGKELWEDPAALHHQLVTVAGTITAWAHHIAGLF
jgi:hypothetical protein